MNEVDAIILVWSAIIVFQTAGMIFLFFRMRKLKNESDKAFNMLLKSLGCILRRSS